MYYSVPTFGGMLFFSLETIHAEESIGLFACLMFFPCHTIVAVVDVVPFPSAAHPLWKAPEWAHIN